MRRIVPFLLILVAFSGVSEALDEGLKDYFGEMLVRVDGVLAALAEGEDALPLALNLSMIANATYREVYLYGGSPDAMELAGRFVDLSDELLELSFAVRGMKEAVDAGDYVRARAYLEVARASLGRLFVLLRALPLNTSEVLDTVGRLSAFLDKYESIMRAKMEVSEFRVFIYPQEPVVFQNVTIIVYAEGLKDVQLFVDGGEVEAFPKGGVLNINYAFQEPGVHEIFCTAVNGSKTVRSNTLYVNVSRLGTYFLISGATDSQVLGFLMDELNRPVQGAPVYLIAPGENKSTVTGDDGSFSFQFEGLQRAMDVILIFPGNEIYEPTSANVTVYPAKLWLPLSISAPESVHVGESFRVIITVNASGSYPITLYVNDEPYESVFVNGRAEIFVTPRVPGQLKLYAIFRGNDAYMPSTSNTVIVAVSPINYASRIGIVLVALFVILLARRLLRGRDLPGEVEVGGKVEQSSWEVSPENVPVILRVYRVVYSFLIRMGALPRSTTPRELLDMFRGASFFDDLSVLTRLHELYFYAKRRVSESGVFRKAARVIVASLGGEL
ncbi:Ig-like domain repeat protein [Pyrococcus yayanosii]|nr:Ig-like domain repeat protein [Pyrococcus yayanosii]